MAARELSPDGRIAEGKVAMSVASNTTRNVGTGLAFIVFPVVFIFAFAVHPGLLHPHLLSPVEIILRAHQAPLLQFGHVLVLLNTALLIVVALHFIKILDRTVAARTGFIGGSLAILGAVMLAADKGAQCLTMSAFDTLSEKEFLQIMPGVLAIFDKGGWLIVLWGMTLLPVGFAIQAIALLRTHTLPRWQAVLFLVGVLLVAIPDGLEIINLTASVLMAIAFIPYGIRLISAKQQKTPLSPEHSEGRGFASTGPR